MILTELPSRIPAIVESVEEHGPQDAIARRLRELGFVNGEEVEVVAKGPLGAEPPMRTSGSSNPWKATACLNRRSATDPSPGKLAGARSDDVMCQQSNAPPVPSARRAR